jgi:hypothetical protein
MPRLSAEHPLRGATSHLRTFATFRTPNEPAAGSPRSVGYISQYRLSSASGMLCSRASPPRRLARRRSLSCRGPLAGDALGPLAKRSSGRPRRALSLGGTRCLGPVCGVSFRAPIPPKAGQIVSIKTEERTGAPPKSEEAEVVKVTVIVTFVQVPLMFMLYEILCWVTTWKLPDGFRFLSRAGWFYG